jgi:putative transposase
LREQLRRRSLDRASLGAQIRAFGRFEAQRLNETWLGDVLVGLFVPHPRVEGSRRARLFAFMDDHSRLLVHGAWAFEENTRAGQMILRAAILRRGLPERLHLDNGAPFRQRQPGADLRRARHPPHPQSARDASRTGKIERAFHLIRERLLLEAEMAEIPSLEHLNERFQAWVERYLNTRRHSETDLTKPGF